MARWGEGYVTDVSYTSGYYRELTPTWLWMASLLGGQRPPDLTREFRWAELGCGNGLTTNCVAAAYPHAEVWGFDFNPAHIEEASRLAAGVGLANAHFLEASFSELARDDRMPMFDFIVIHGVYSWIAPAIRDDMLAVLGRRLAPGGIVYVSYNTPTGWDAMVPLQYLMRMLASGMQGRSDHLMPAVLDTIDRLVEANAAFFQRNPALVTRLKNLRGTNPRYVAHEFLNEHWHPLMFAQVAEQLAGAKCDFVASATLTDNFDYTAVPSTVLPLLGEARDRRMKETLRDFGCAQSFRRDVFRRGLATLTAAQHLSILDNLRVVAVLPRPEGDFRFGTSMGEMLGNKEIYEPLFDRLYRTGSMTFAEARGIPMETPRAPMQVLESLTLLMAAGVVHPAVPAPIAEQARASAAAFNAEVTRINLAGGEMTVLVSPEIGGALGADLLETLVRRELADPDGATEGAGVDRLMRQMTAGLRSSERHLLKDGEAVAEPEEEGAMLRDMAQRLTGVQWPLRRNLRIYD